MLRSSQFTLPWLLLLFLPLCFTSLSHAAEIPSWPLKNSPRWQMNRNDSSISFSVDFLVLSKVQGLVKNFDARLSMPENDFEQSKIDIKIEAASIDMGDDKTNQDIHSPDFFDAHNHPYVLFKVHEIKPFKKNIYLANMFVTVKGMTKNARFLLKKLPSSEEGKEKFQLYGSLDRLRFGMKLKGMLDMGGFFLGKEIKVECLLEFSLQRTIPTTF